MKDPVTTSVSRIPLSILIKQINDRNSNTTTDNVKDIMHQQRRKTASAQTPRDKFAVQDVDELEGDIASITNAKEKFVHVCKHGSDSNSLMILEKLVEEFPKVNVKTIVDPASGGAFLIHLCAQRNKVLCMEWLHQRGASLECTDKTGATPLLFAAAHNCPDAIAFLIAQGANVNAKDLYMKFALYIALRNGNFVCAEILQQARNIDVHLRGIKGNTALHTMAEEGNLQAVQFLIETCKASPLRRNYDESNVLQCCLKHPYIVQYICQHVSQKDLIKLLLSVDVNGTNVMHLCAREGHYSSLIGILKIVDFTCWSSDQISSLVNSPDKRDDTPLLIAVKQNKSEIVQFLCQCQEVSLNDGDYKNNTALYYAVSSKDQVLISALTNAEASLTPCEETDSSQSESDATPMVCCGCLTSLRLLLAIILSVVGVTCIIAVTAISLGFFASTVTRSTNIIREKTFTETMTFMSTSTDQLSMMGRTAFAQINERFNLSDVEQVQDFTWALFSANKKYSQLLLASYCGNNLGGISAFVYLGDTSSVIHLENFVDVTKQNIYDVEQDYSLNKANLTGLAATYNITQEQAQLDPTFLNTQRNNNTFWSKSYAAAGTAGGIGSFLFLTYAHPIRDPVTNEWYGYCAVDSSTETLNSFLVSHALQGSVTVVIERSTGYLIGTSDPTIPLYTAGETNESPTVRYDGTDGKNKLMTAMLKYARAKYGGKHFTNITSLKSEYDIIRFNGERVFINIGKIEDDSQLDWIVVQALPTKLFYRQFYNAIIIISCFSIGLLIINLGVAVIFANIFMTPLKKIIDQAEDIKMLQLEKVEKELQHGMSYFTEIRYLQRSFQSMTKRLKQFRSFIPDHILGVIENEVSGNEVVFRKSTDDSTLREMSKHYMSKKGAIQHALTSSTLRSEYVTIMRVEVTNLSRLLDMYSAQDISDVIQDYLFHLKECIRNSNGQLVSISTNSAIIAWNCLIPQGDHESKACRAAVSITDSVSEMNTFWKEKDMPTISVFVTISSGAVYSGNISDNTEKMKLFSIVGRPVDRTDKMLAQNRKWQVNILATEEVYQSAKEDFHFRPLCKVVDEEEHFTIYQLGRPKSQEEWVNEMTNKNAWMEFTEAFRMYEDGNKTEAYEILSKLVQTYSNDNVAHRMLEYIKPCE